MSVADLVRKMADAGASAELIALAVEAVEAAAHKDDERKRRDRERKRNVRRLSADIPQTIQGTSEEIPATVSPEVFPQEIYNQPPILTPSVGSLARAKKPENKTPCGELEPVIGAELAAEVVDHRRRMRKPMTSGSAKRLAAKFLSVHDPQAAARMMIDRGWQGFEADWIANSPPRAGPPRTAENSAPTNLFQALRNRIESRPKIPDDDMPDEQSGGIRGGPVRLLSAR